MRYAYGYYDRPYGCGPNAYPYLPYYGKRSVDAEPAAVKRYGATRKVNHGSRVAYGYYDQPYGCGPNAYPYYQNYYGKRSADAEPAAPTDGNTGSPDAEPTAGAAASRDAEPDLWFLNYGPWYGYWPYGYYRPYGHGYYYGKRSADLMETSK